MQHLTADITEDFFSLLKSLSFCQCIKLYVELIIFQLQHCFFHITSITERVNIIIILIYLSFLDIIALMTSLSHNVASILVAVIIVENVFQSGTAGPEG